MFVLISVPFPSGLFQNPLCISYIGFRIKVIKQPCDYSLNNIRAVLLWERPGCRAQLCLTVIMGCTSLSKP